MPTDLRAKALSRVSEIAEKWTTRLSGIFVEGVEVTQGLQYRGAKDHLTDPADRGADNSLGLVADKPAVVRAYVRTLLFPVADVTGTITVQRMRYGVWVDSGTLAQQFPGTITSGRCDLPTEAERGLSETGVATSDRMIYPGGRRHRQVPASFGARTSCRRGICSQGVGGSSRR